MHNGLKLLTGLAATVLLARGAALVEGRTILGRMAGWAQMALADEEVTDGSISFRAGSPHPGRTILVSGTADAATRAAIIARLKRHPLVIDARWEER
ncbi:MAG: hypothetical protein KGQ52_02335 [Alphaproteobacteria bacterium]|nr:hypothetical protein [Alphaproteobacteria bacterium]